MDGRWHSKLIRTCLALVFFIGVSPWARADALDSWQTTALTTNGQVLSITYGNGVFVGNTLNGMSNFFGRNPGGLIVSPDGSNWVYPSIPFFWFPKVLFANGVFVAIGENNGSDSGEEYFSTNGMTWTPGNYSGGTGEQLNDSAYGNGVFVDVGFLFEEGPLSYCDTSTNGVDWTNRLMGTTNFMASVAYGNGNFIAVGGPNVGSPTNGYILRSPTGTTWFTIPSSFSGPLSGIEYVNGRFYVTETIATGHNHYYSTTGTNWTKFTTPVPTAFIPNSPSTPTNGIYIAVGTNGTVLTSTDASNWTSRITGVTNDLFAVAAGPVNLLLGGSAGVILRSGSTLPVLSGQQQTAPGGFQVTLGGGTGPSYRLEGSTDLTTWSNLFTFTNIEASSQFLDVSATNSSRKFYRAVWP